MAKSIKQKDLNLLLAMSQGTTKKSLNSMTILLIFLIVIVIAAVAAFLVFLNMEAKALEDEKQTIQMFTEDPNVIAQYNESIQAQGEAQRMTAQSEQLRQVLLGISSFPDLDSSAYYEIYRIASSRVTISDLAYDSTTGLLTFNAASDTASGVPIFIAQLRYTELFEDIQYAGYAEQTANVPGSTTIDPVTGVSTTTSVEVSEFTFAVTCLAKAPTPTLPASVQ